MRSEGLEAAERHIVFSAYRQAEKSFEASVRRGEKKDRVSEEEIWSAVGKYYKSKEKDIRDISFVEGLDDESLRSACDSSRRILNFVDAFFVNFNKTTRPLVFARVGDGKFRVLGRSLVNKLERTGLELKEAKRNSPLGALIEGGISLYQALQQEKREKELHELQLKIKNKELELMEARLHGERINNLALELKLANDVREVVEGTDVESIMLLPQSVVKERIVKAYGVERSNATQFMYRQGLSLDRESISIVDVKV